MKRLRILAEAAALWGICAAGLARAEGPPIPTSADAADETRAHPDLEILGFGDLGYSSTDAATAPGTSNSGFFQGQFVLHFRSALSGRFGFFGEVSLTSSGHGGYGSAPTTAGGSPNAEVHRMVVNYTHSDALKLSIGRFHTPVSYWNVAFHHGPWLQTTIARPFMLDFASPFLPLHILGLFAEGAIPSGPLNLRYMAGVGNGRGSGPGRVDAPGDVDGHRAWLVRLSSRPARPGSLELGAALYEDEASLMYGRTQARFRERIWNGYVAFTKEEPELIAELVSVRHRRLGRSDSFSSWAAYVQMAWRLDAWSGRLKPYARWEESHLDRDDHVIEGAARARGVLAGLRVDVSELVAVKAEYHRQADDAAPFRNGVFSQVSFTF